MITSVPDAGSRPEMLTCDPSSPVDQGDRLVSMNQPVNQTRRFLEMIKGTAREVLFRFLGRRGDIEHLTVEAARAVTRVLHSRQESPRIEAPELIGLIEDECRKIAERVLSARSGLVVAAQK